MEHTIHSILKGQPVSASAPCRIDLGGTLDIAVFFYPMSYLGPLTFNIALDMRTTVRVSAHTPGFVKVSSKGFDPAEYPIDRVPFNHPMGLIFAIAAYFRIDGVHIEINSASPPKSALGGSSSAAVAVIGAFNRLLSLAGTGDIKPERIPELAHALEETVAGVPCGCQDQMAAAYGGVHAWHWKGVGRDRWYERESLLEPRKSSWLNERMLVAYCGIPHESADINSRWIRGFIDGTFRKQWVDIIASTHGFIRAFKAGDVPSAVRQMQRETAIRREITPDVLDHIGGKLVSVAEAAHCAARFTGAGGGGCIWAFGEPAGIASLKPEWEKILDSRNGARLLQTSVDMAGLTV